jgi:hypothetical protein
MTITFSNSYVDTGVAIPPVPSNPAKFFVVAHTDTGDMRMKFRFRDVDRDGTLSNVNDQLDILCPAPVRADSQTTWRLQLTQAPTKKPAGGDVYQLHFVRPLNDSDLFTFTTGGEHVDAALASQQYTTDPYVVPNPYVGAAPFEPARFAISGRGERRVEFRNVPLNATVRVYTVRGELVQTLHQDGGTDGFVAWNLRTKDNLDLAAGLYIYQVEAPGVRTFTGKMAVIK